MDTLKLIIERELNNKADNTYGPQKNKLKSYLEKIVLKDKINFVLKLETTFFSRKLNNLPNNIKK